MSLITPQQRQEVTVVSGPQSLSSDIWRGSTTDYAVFGILVIVCFTALRYFGFWGLLLSAVLTGLLLWPLTWNRVYYSGVELLDSGWIRFGLQDTLWENPYTGLHREGYRDTRVRRFIRGLIIRAHPYPYRVDRLYDFGLVYTQPTDSDSVIIGGDGSKIAAMSPQDQHARHSVINEAILQLGAYQGLATRSGMRIGRRPANLHAVDEDRDACFMPDVVVPEAHALMLETGLSADELYAQGKLTKLQLRDYRVHTLTVKETNEELELNANDPDMVFTITIRRSPQLKKAANQKKGAKLKEEALRYERIVQMADDVVEMLKKASVYNPRVMDADECEDYLRRCWDVGTLRDYYMNPEPAYPAIPVHHPQFGIYSTRNALITDGTGHSVVQVIKLPKEIEPNLLPQMFIMGGVTWMSRTTITESNSGNVEYLGIGWLSGVLSSLMSAFEWLRLGVKTEQHMAQLEAKQRELATQGHRERTNIYLEAADPDPVALKRSREELLRMLKRIGGKGKRIRGRSRLPAYAWTAMTGIPARDSN